MLQIIMDLLFKLNLLNNESQPIILVAIILFAVIMFMGFVKKAIKTIAIGLVCLVISASLFVVKANVVDANNLSFTAESISNEDTTIEYKDITRVSVDNERFIRIESDEDTIEVNVGSNYAGAIKKTLEKVISEKSTEEE